MSDNLAAVLITAILVVGLLVIVLAFYLPEILDALVEWRRRE